MTDLGQSGGRDESTFTCANCGGTFPKAWSDDEAKAEADSIWGDITEDEGGAAVICDDCFKEFMPWMVENHPERLTDA